MSIMSMELDRDSLTSSEGGGDMKKQKKSGMILIQPDWDVAFRGKDDAIWISYKPKGEKSCQGSISRPTRSSDKWQGDDSFKVLRCSPLSRSLTVEHRKTGLKTKFLGPNRVFKGIHLKSVNCLDVTRGGLGVSACSAGQVHIWDTDRGIVRRTLEGHVGEVTSCRFFPSGIVVATGGIDMRLRIWSAEDGQNPVTLVGHGGAVTDIGIIDKGRNIFSSSRDGKCKLWDVGQSACLHTYELEKGVINSCDLKAVDGISKERADPTNDREVGTTGKIVIAGLESGEASLIDVRLRDVVASVALQDAVNSVRWVQGGSGNDLIVMGCQDGRVVIFDSRNFHTGSELCTIHDSASAVISILAVDSVKAPGGGGLLVGRQDGTCCMYDNSSLSNGTCQSDDSSMTVQLTGSDCDPIYGLASADGGESVFTGARDGFIRRYNLIST